MMASDRLVFTADASHPEAAKVRSLLDYLTQARNMARHLKSTQPHYGTGAADDHVELASALGASSGSSGDARALKDLIGTVADELSGAVNTAIAQLLDRAG